jgi:hypothetical protein
MKTDVNVHSKSNKQKTLKKKELFFVASASCQSLTKKAESGSVPKCHGPTTLLLSFMF